MIALLSAVGLGEIDRLRVFAISNGGIDKRLQTRIERFLMRRLLYLRFGDRRIGDKIVWNAQHFGRSIA
ncbi:hypothetical protein IQ235_16985 [Oscillatoriales cyanobacterium LEGE 11467]|uniref:Uncharacterized protein n=1 Tax=Zarconia navalis LEGE 11467 TaxID=1828826 RepID=A0A928VY71_9CYAN|nr:hypothetical protein [Zarconia navalis]MBE9042469.1 hypothetical protein [Zarconia navalis LEGE 11467]